MIDGLKPYDECKASEVPWLGEIPRHWDTRRNRYIFREVDARSTTGEETQLSMSQIHGLVESSKIDTWRMRSESYVGGKLCEPDDLVLNRLKAHLGVFAHAKMGGVISPDYSVFRPRTDANTRYFEKVLKTPLCVGEIRRFTKGIVEGFWRLYTDDFYNLTLPVPPPEEQAAIVRFLDHADRRIRRYIRAKRQLIALLDEQKQAIINLALTRGFNPDTPLVPSGLDWLGQVPAHWSVKRIKYVMKVVDKRSESGQEVLLSMRKHHGLVPYHEHFSKPPQAADLKNFKLIEKGQIAVNRMQAGFGLIFVSPQAGLVSPDFGVFQPTGEVLPEFLGELFRSRIVSAKFQAESKGLGTGKSGFSRLYDDRIGWIHIAYPPTNAEQREILETLKAELDECDRPIQIAENEIELLQEYRTRFIADVVTGKLDVREAAAALPDELKAGEADPEDLLNEDDTTDDVELDTEPEEVEA